MPKAISTNTLFYGDNLPILREHFADESIDLHITQDVFEHLFHPDKAFLEIARTLKPGGAHLFTVPLVNKNQRSLQHAALRPDGTVDHRMPATYHDDPIGPQSALVTFHWGYDICDYILNATGLATSIFTPDDLSRGLRAEYIDVLMTIKPDPSPKATDLAAVSD